MYRTNILFIIVAILSLNSLANTKELVNRPEIFFEKSIPEDGSVISSFDFDLVFDLSNFYEVYGDENVIFCLDNFCEGEVNLYLGSSTSGILLESIYNADLDNETVQTQSGNTLHFSFENVPVNDGQSYTIEVKGWVYCYKNPKEQSQILDLNETPIILHYTGKSDTIGFGLLNTSVDGISEMCEAEPMTIKCTKEVSLIDNAKARLYQRMSGVDSALWEWYTSLVSESDITVSEKDPCEISFDFGEICMYKGVDYIVEIDKGTVFDKDDDSKSLPRISYVIQGSAIHYFEAVDFKVNKDSRGMIESFEIEFACDDSALTDIIESNGGLVKIIDSNDKELGVALLEPSESEWPRYKFHKSELPALLPCSELYLAADEGALNGRLDGLSVYSVIGGLQNRQFRFKFPMPEADEVTGIPDVEFGAVGIGEFNVWTDAIEDGYAAGKLETIEIILEPYEFMGNDERPWAKENQTGSLYEIGENEDILIKEFPLSSEIRGHGLDNMKSAVICPINEVLYEGKQYRLTIPENAIGSKHWYRAFGMAKLHSEYTHYQHSPRFDFVFNGLTQSSESKETAIAGPTVSGCAGSIIIRNLGAKDVVTVYGTDGTLCGRVADKEGDFRMQLGSGMYVVVVNTKATKILI